MEIVNDKLQGVDFRQSPNVSEGKTISPQLIVVHFTAGSSAQSSIEHLLKQGSGASAHLVIGLDGKVSQLASFNQRAWHAGRSTWRGRRDVNSFSIGIELDNPGRLEPVGDRYKAWFGTTYAADKVVRAQHKHEHKMSCWHIYPEAQLAACMEVCEALAGHYPIADIVGHEDIAPGRKTDPGPAFPLDNFRSRLFGRDIDSEPVEVEGRGSVEANLLNFRDGPDGLVDGPPLTEGTRVDILERQGDWLHVDVVRRGWVSAQFVRED